MTHSSDMRRYALELAKIGEDLHRVDHDVDALLGIGQRLSHLGNEIANACESAHISAVEEAAA